MANPPLRARLHWYRLTAAEFSLLVSMCEHCSDGSTIWASIARLAAYSKLSERNVQRLVRGFCKRGILSQLAPGSAGRRRPATYRLNEAALKEDPAMAPYLFYQKQLPGITRLPVPGEPIRGDKIDAQLVTPCHQSGDKVSPDSKAFDPRAFYPKPDFQKNFLRPSEPSCPEATCKVCMDAGTLPDQEHSICPAMCDRGKRAIEARKLSPKSAIA